MGRVKSPEQVAKEQSGQGFERSQPKAKAAPKAKADALAVHSQYEQLAKGLAASGDNRLNTLASAFVESRKASVAGFADFVELAETGLVDLKLIEAELIERAQKRGESPDSFRIDNAGFAFDVAAVNIGRCIQPFPTAKAIAGV